MLHHEGIIFENVVEEKVVKDDRSSCLAGLLIGWLQCQWLLMTDTKVKRFLILPKYFALVVLVNKVPAQRGFMCQVFQSVWCHISGASYLPLVPG